ncbi:hypothetical protein CRG98_042499, partial [Punica granatum]
MENQNLRCEFHQGAPGHTMDTCWRLRDKIQEMIDTRQISFNEAKPPNVHANPLPDHGSGSGPSVNMISITAIEEEEDSQKSSIPFVINYAPVEVAFAPIPFVIEVPAKEPYHDSRVPWTYESEVASAKLEMSAMGITRSGRVYQGPEPVDKGKALATVFSTAPEAVSFPTKKVIDQEAEAFMKVIKASEYKVVEQMGKSPAHISLLALLLNSEPHRNALLKVLTAAQVPKDTALDRIEKTVNSIFSNQISFSEDEFPSEGQGHLRALHIVCKCNNHVVGNAEEPCTLRIGTGLDPAQRARMIDFLTEYREVFAWSYADMPGLNTSIVKHFLPFDTERFPPKRQHLRRQRADLLLRIKEEVIKQVDAGFLEVYNYSEWVANIVPLEKKNGKVRVCIDYRDLNRASPKDNFPLPHIDVLMPEEDKVKTTFITMWGTFCYKVMPFGLKNARATYQRAMVTLFHDMMHKEIEVYVDDMIAKSKEGEDHLVNLKRLFDRLRKYKLRLNPAKCTFGGKSGKLLGFIVSEKGIEVDPDKVKAIMELPPPSTVREIRSFLGRLNYIACFIANLTDKCQPLFRLLRKNVAVEWDDECQKAFDTIKAYLVQPPVLVSPSPDRPLILYLT